MTRLAGVAGIVIALAGCQPAGKGAPKTRPAAGSLFGHGDLVGTWRWLLRTTADGATRVEDEVWRFRPVPGDPRRLAGRYLRTVEVRSDDQRPFQCNQRTRYRQRAVFEVEVELVAAGFEIRETEFRTEPSPCDHEFRRLASYRAELAPGRLALRWDGGAQTLHQIDDAHAALEDEPWAAAPEPYGAWRWEASSFDRHGNVYDEREWWELTRRSDTRLDATYRRRVTVRSPDGGTIACAGGPSWTYDDAYILDGQREDEHWHFYERAVEPGDHACLRASPRRALDEATAEQQGDYLVLEWRGKRRQVLYRPD